MKPTDDEKAPVPADAEKPPEAAPADKPADAATDAAKPKKEKAAKTGRTPAKAPATANTPKKPAAKGTSKPASAPKGKTAAPAKATAKKPASKPPAAKKAADKKPAVEKDFYGFKKGSLKSQAAAMYADPKGATLPQIKDKLGSAQLNVLVDLEKEGYKIERKKEAGKGKRPITRYFLRAKAKAKKVA